VNELSGVFCYKNTNKKGYLMLLTREVEVKWNGNTKKWYMGKGYRFAKLGDMFLSKVEDLMDGSGITISVECDGCGKISNIRWKNYKRCVKENNTYYCRICALNGYKKWINFDEWCINNNRQDILDRWDYELNNCNPSGISYGSNKKYYFKCPTGLHESELKCLNSFTSGHEGSICCNSCNSFAQWGIDNFGEDFLEKYWDYDKNVIDPWKTTKCSGRKVWIKCQEKEYHGSYKVQCNSFIIINCRCPFCCNFHGNVHSLDSLGSLFPQVFDIWSDKNKKSPYEYTPNSVQKVWFKCLDGKHQDFKRSINSSNTKNFRCPECSNMWKGEIKICEILANKNINYIPQKTYTNLCGLGNGLLSYDFYLPDYNLLIEYQGEYHDGTAKKQTEKEFIYQQEHDKRKRDYAIQNNINLLEIWYWDYCNIEEILYEVKEENDTNGC